MKNELTVTQHNSLDNINDVPPPLTQQDEACLEEIHDVLARHGCVDRFGIYLLHKHFDLKPGEIMVEACDPVNRQLLARPVRSSHVKKTGLVQTMWRFNSAEKGQGKAERQCESFCPTDAKGHHLGYKDHYS